MIRIFKYILLYVAGFITILHNAVPHQHDQAASAVEDFIPIEKDNSMLSWLALLIQTDMGEGHLHNVVKDNPGDSGIGLDLAKVLPPVPAIATYAPLLLDKQTEQAIPLLRTQHFYPQFIAETTSLRGPPSHA